MGGCCKRVAEAQKGIRLIFKIILLRPILAALTWFAHHLNSHLYGQEHAPVYGKEHSPDSLYSVMARTVLDVLGHHLVLDRCVALDVGGGSGSFAEKLLDGGAEKVYLFDSSTEMLSVAASRLARFGDHAVTWQANVEDEIRLENSLLDCVLCVQVLHYIENWDFTATEFFRVLKKGGCVVVVTLHPAIDTVIQGIGSYFEREKRESFLSSGGKLWPVTYWRRPLEAMLAPFLSAGFVIVDVVEPYLQAPRSRPWWDIADSLFQYFPPYMIFVLRK